MTVSTEISSNEYTGNGVTTDFDYKFRIFKANQLSVISSDADGDNVVTLRLGTDYIVTGANKSTGGKVVLTKPLANGHKISIYRDIPITQETSFRNQSKFFAETHEDAFDYLTMIVQRIWGSLGSLYLKRPNILANWFDAKGYRIANLGKPKRDSDAVDLGTLKDEISGVNSTILKREKRLLRVDDMDIEVLPKANDRAGNVLTFDKNGRPIVVAPASGSAVDVLNKLASDSGSSLIGHDGKTVADYLNSQGVLVSSGDDLHSAIQLSIPNQTIIIDGDVVLNEGVSVPHAINFKRVNNGRILWNGSVNMIRIIPPVVATIATPVEFKQGDSIAILPENHGIKDGMMLCAFSNERRTGQSIGDYYRGQYFFVRKVTGNSIEFYPSPIEGFTSNKIEARYPTENMRHDIVIKHIAPTGNAGGVIFDMPYSLNCSGNIVIEGNRDPNVGIGIGGHNHEFNVSVQGITHGADGYNVLGYGVTCTGTQITIHGSARNCRHAFEVPSRDIISGSITFNMEITKEKGNPLYLYIGGVHCNVVDWKFRGRVSGSGMLIMDRSGTGDIKCHFDGQDDGFEYAHVSVTDIYPRTTRIHGCTMSDDGRKCLVDWDIKGQPAANGMLKISGNVLKGRKRIIRFRDSSAATSHTYRVRVNDNTGQAVSIHNLDLNDSNVYLELSDNTLSSSGLPAFPDYMAGTGVSNNVNYDLRSSNNNIDDSVTSGMYSLKGRIGDLSISSTNDKNTTLPFFNMNPEYLGTLKVFNVLSLDTAGQSVLTPTDTTRYEDVGMISFCRIRHNSASPIISGIAWPVVYTGNRFNTTFDATLVSTKRPQGGNVNLSGKAINWNGQNIAI